MDTNAVLDFLHNKIKFALGECSPLCHILITLIIVDIITGTIKAIAEGNVQSKIMKEKFPAKMLIFSMICVAEICDKILTLDVSVRTVVLYYYVAEEALSIIENTGRFISYPKILTKAITQLKEQGGESNEQKDIKE